MPEWRDEGKDAYRVAVAAMKKTNIGYGGEAPITESAPLPRQRTTAPPHEITEESFFEELDLELANVSDRYLQESRPVSVTTRPQEGSLKEEVTNLLLELGSLTERVSRLYKRL